MKISASKSIRTTCFNFERLSRSFRRARQGIFDCGSTLERLYSDAEFFMYRTYRCKAQIVLAYFFKQSDRSERFPPSEFSLAEIKIGV